MCSFQGVELPEPDDVPSSFDDSPQFSSWSLRSFFFLGGHDSAILPLPLSPSPPGGGFPPPPEAEKLSLPPLPDEEPDPVPLLEWPPAEALPDSIGAPLWLEPPASLSPSTGHALAPSLSSPRASGLFCLSCWSDLEGNEIGGLVLKGFGRLRTLYSSVWIEGG